MSKKKYKKKRFYFRNAGVTATASMALVLLLVGLLASVLFLTRDMGREIKEKMTLSIVLKDEVTPKQTERIKTFTEKSAFAKSVEYISKEQALQDHIDALGEDPAEFLGWNPLFASLEVNLNAEYAHNDSIVKIEKQLSRFEYIDKISYQKDMIAMVNENVRKISFILLGLAAVLMLISFVLINNTVRLRIYSNRFIINTMKLVGAKSWFIRKPYVGQSIINGVVAAVVAMLLLSGLVYYMKYKFGLDTKFITLQTALIITGIVLVSGILLTAISSYFAVGRYIKMRTDEMYYV
ncbi:MAG: cell division protein FtsX [Porphyromonadaceae bacterium]|jgi:cell division transport system permease protein|nr:cell division protein FtsX [Porphyromonadaceae bacterium]